MLPSWFSHLELCPLTASQSVWGPASRLVWLCSICLDCSVYLSVGLFDLFDLCSSTSNLPTWFYTVSLYVYCCTALCKRNKLCQRTRYCQRIRHGSGISYCLIFSLVSFNSCFLLFKSKISHSSHTCLSWWQSTDELALCLMRHVW